MLKELEILKVNILEKYKYYDEMKLNKEDLLNKYSEIEKKLIPVDDIKRILE